MKNLRTLLFCCFALVLSSLYAETPQNFFVKDQQLVNELKDKQIRLFVIRNGEAVNNLDNLMISWRSPSFRLTESGRTTVLQSSQHFLDDGVQAIYSSPLYRALNTVEIVESVLNLPYYKIFVTEKLRQQNFGIFEGANYSDYKSFFPSSYALYTKGAPEGESGKYIYVRTRELLWKIANGNDKVVLVVTHAFNIVYINCLLTGSFGNFPELGEYFVFDFSGDPNP